MIDPHSGVSMLLEYGGDFASREFQRLEGQLLAGMRQAHNEGECPSNLCPACKLGHALNEREKSSRPAKEVSP